jgi:murein DD-endopeptidase MepM/ murein hydrolase activator NlpD
MLAPSVAPFVGAFLFEIFMLIFPKMREPDDFGAGYFGAPRGSGTHNGVDFTAEAGSACYSVTEGVVTKFGYPYADDLSYRYVEVTHDEVTRFRYFYVEPIEDLQIGDKVFEGLYLGAVQDVAGRYETDDKKMNNHIHFEVIEKGKYVDPVDALNWAGGPNLYALGLVPA